MSLPFLLEIGTEEIPDWMIVDALASLKSQFVTAMGGEFGARVNATPRRLVLRAAGLAERQADVSKKQVGPPVQSPPAAVAGFARKQGVTPEELHQEAGRYVVTKLIPGRATRDILAEALPEIILKITFPKTMYWTAKTGPRFIRPIRWIVALLGEEIVPLEIAGVKSGNVSSGHRVLGASRIPVTIADYEQTLRENGVILSADERRSKIQAEIGSEIKPDPALLETLVYLTEFPTAISGSFDARFLDLPREVLETVMRHHQKNFSVEGKDGKLAPRFVAVMNISGDPDGLVQRGNERVLRARFNDARFFWETDQRKKLADRISDLAHVTFHAKLGSYLAKTERMMALVKQMGGDDDAIRAAQLCKCDLTTELVKELTELQGVVGGLYARAQGEPEEVAQAIYDHYKPESMEDAIPGTLAGQLVSLADKLDTLRECFRIGLMPTGSRDPFALRRAAQGVVRILAEARLHVPVPLDIGDVHLHDFILDRVRYYFKEIRGFAYDEVNAVLATGGLDLGDIGDRLAAIQAVRPTENFEPLAASFKRMNNILRQAEFDAKDAPLIDAGLLEPGPEAKLYEEFARIRKETADQDYRQALATIASLRPALDQFFDKVLVNAPDPKVRLNRLTLLHKLLSELSTIADFSEIVTSSQETR